LYRLRSQGGSLEFLLALNSLKKFEASLGDVVRGAVAAFLVTAALTQRTRGTTLKLLDDVRIKNGHLLFSGVVATGEATKNKERKNANEPFPRSGLRSPCLGDTYRNAEKKRKGKLQ
jgi:hypothetical protein